MKKLLLSLFLLVSLVSFADTEFEEKVQVWTNIFITDVDNIIGIGQIGSDRYYMMLFNGEKIEITKNQFITLSKHFFELVEKNKDKTYLFFDAEMNSVKKLTEDKK